MQRQVIEINGRHYDAVSGTLLTTDGFIRHANPVKQKGLPVRSLPKRSIARKDTAPTPSAKKLHEVKPSKTLMRSAVKKPLPSVSSLQIPLDHKVETPHQITPKKTVASIDESRLDRAKSLSRSEHIGHFDAPKRASPVAVTPEYKHVPVQLTPDKPEETTDPVPPPERTNNPLDIFSKAIAGSNHFVDIQELRKAYNKKFLRHALSMASGFTALLIITGFATYINSPMIQIRVAGIRAGVHTAAIDFDKTGFNYAGVNVSESKRTIGLTKNGFSYKLVQQSTNWDGKTMIQHVASTAANGQPNYTVVSVGDDNVYRFDKSKATWIKDGVWYSVSGNATITDSQLAALVKNT